MRRPVLGAHCAVHAFCDAFPLSLPKCVQKGSDTNNPSKAIAINFFMRILLLIMIYLEGLATGPQYVRHPSLAPHCPGLLVVHISTQRSDRYGKPGTGLPQFVLEKVFLSIFPKDSLTNSKFVMALPFPEFDTVRGGV